MSANRTRAAALAASLAALGSLTVASTASAKLQMPFKCGVKVYGEARADHSPPNSIDFNGLGGGNTDLGMPVVAAGPGVISVSQYYTTNGYGNAIEIRHPSGARTFYAHLRDRRFGVGRHVRQGQVIGHVGHSSAIYTFTAHLHYEQRNAAGHTIRARFNGHPAAPYSNMENSTLMRSRNCRRHSGGGNPAPPPPSGGSKRGVALPKGVKTRRAASIQTDHGLAVSARRAPRTSAKRVLRKHDGDKVRIVCQRRGERVKGKFGASNLWDLIAIGNGRGAYVTDTYVFTGSDGRVAPRCP